MVRVVEKHSAEDFNRSKSKGSPRIQYLEEYKGFLQDLQVHEGLTLDIDEGENKGTVKNRLKRAAQSLGFPVQFRRRKGGSLSIWRITQGEDEAEKARQAGIVAKRRASEAANLAAGKQAKPRGRQKTATR